MRKLTKAEIEARAKRGAQVEEHPRKVDGRMSAPQLEAAIERLAKAQAEATKQQHEMMLRAIDGLVKAVGQLKGTDVSDLVKAVSELRLEASTQMHAPVDYLMTAKRDPQRHLIDLEKGVRFTAIPARLDS